MKYLIATHAMLLSVELDEGWNVTDAQVINLGHHYGIAFYKEEGKDALLVKRHDHELMVLDRTSLKPIQNPIPLLGDTGAVHQVSYTNGGVYHANTDYNSVVYQTLDGEVYHDYHFEGKNFDHNHVNSIFPAGQQIYALLHNKGRTLTELAVLNHNPEAGFRLDHCVSIWDHGCHNAYVEGTHLYYNASSLGGFVVVDLLQEEQIARLDYTGHTKGLSVVDNTVVIGFSEHAERSMRAQTKGHLAVIDKQTCAEIATVDLNNIGLPQPVGNINEIRCISHPESSHAAPEALSIDWSSMRLARRNKTQFAAKHLALYVSRGYRKLVGNKKL